MTRRLDRHPALAIALISCGAVQASAQPLPRVSFRIVQTDPAATTNVVTEVIPPPFGQQENTDGGRLRTLPHKQEPA